MIPATHLVISNINLMSLQEESFINFDNGVQSSNGVMTEEEILKEVIRDDGDDDDDDLDEGKEGENLEIVNESFQCPTGSVVM